MRRVVAAAALAVSAVVVLAGCQGTTSVAPSPVRSTDLTSSDGGFDHHAVVGVVLRGSAATPSDSGDGETREARFRTGLTEAGFRPDVRVASGDEAATQRTAVRALVRSGAKALLVDAADPSSLAAELGTAHDAGVVVVSLGKALPEKSAGGGGYTADYRVANAGTASDADLVSRSVDVVQSLQRGEKPDAD